MTTENQLNTGNSNSFFQKNNIRVDVFERKILLKLPKNDQDIQFIRSIHYCKWDKIHFHWVIPNYPGNLERIQFYFGVGLHNLPNTNPNGQVFRIQHKMFSRAETRYCSFKPPANEYALFLGLIWH